MGEGDPHRAGRAAARDDSGAIVLGWLVRVSVLIVVVAVVLFDGISLLLNPLQAQDDADQALAAASLSWHTSHDRATALSSARESIGVGSTSRTTIADKGVTIDAKGHITVVVQREAHTLVLGRVADHVSALHKYLVADALSSQRS